VIGKARAERARWIVDLAALQHICLTSGRRYVTLNCASGEGEWTEIWMRTREWNRAPERPRELMARFRAQLRAITGLELLVEQPEDELEVRIFVGAPELVELVELDFREAAAIRDYVDGLAESTAIPEAPDPPVPAVVEDYCTKKRTLEWVARRWGRGVRTIRRILANERRAIRPPGRRRIEEIRARRTWLLALRARSRGATIAEVAAILDCTWDAAKRFLARHSALSPGTSATP